MLNFWSFIPKYLLKHDSIVNFFTKLKEYYDSYTIQIDTLQFASDIDGKYFKYVGDSFGCFFDENMTEQEQRISIYESIRLQRNPLVFENWKPIIDRITGGDCDVYLGRVFIDPAFYGTAVYGTDVYVEGEEIEELDYDNVDKYGTDLYGTALYGVPFIDDGYGVVIYGTGIYGGESKLYATKTIGESRLPNIYIDIKIDQSLITQNLLDKLSERLSVLAGGFFNINIGIFIVEALRVYVRIR